MSPVFTSSMGGFLLSEVAGVLAKSIEYQVIFKSGVVLTVRAHKAVEEAARLVSDLREYHHAQANPPQTIARSA